MRLIDADALKRTYTQNGEYENCIYDGAFIVLGIDEQPTVDAVPVIRCKDCKWFVHDDDCYGDCSNEGGAKGFVYTTDYCSRAERKDNG